MAVVRRGWGGFAGGLGEGIAQTGSAYLQHIFHGEDLDKENALALARQNNAQTPEIARLMLEHPEYSDQLEKWGSGRGMNLHAFHASDADLANPLANKINSATSEENVPGIDQILSSLKTMGRPSLTAPSYGPMPTDGTPPPSINNPTAPPGIADTPALPSQQFGPTQNPTIQSLMQARQDRLAAIAKQRQIDLGALGDKSRVTAYNDTTGKNAATNENFPTALNQDIERGWSMVPIHAEQTGQDTSASFWATHGKPEIAAGAAQAGANAGATARATLAPDIVAGEANKAGQLKAADLNAEYNSIVTPHILDFKQRETDITNKAKAVAERQKDIEDAKVAGVNLARQVAQLKPMYDAAMTGDATAAKLYHDHVEQAAVNAGRASGYKGQFREYEYQAARGLFPSLIADQALGTAPAKWKALNDLIRTAPTVLQNVPVGSGIDDYIKAVQDAMSQSSDTSGDDPVVASFKARKAGKKP